MIKKLLWMSLSLVISLSSGCCKPTKEFPKSMARPSQDIKQESKETAITPAPEDLALRGVGIKTLLLMKVFVAGLYLPSHVESNHAMDTDVPKCISVLFYAKISAKDFSDYTVDHMKPNLSKAEFESLSGQLKEMEELFPNITPQDTLALLYKPNVGTTFIHNGKVRGTMEGELFSKAIFSTWLGAKPFDRVLKRQILGEKKV